MGRHIFDKHRARWLMVAAGGLSLFLLTLRHHPTPIATGARETELLSVAARPTRKHSSSPLPHAPVLSHSAHPARVEPPTLQELTAPSESARRRMVEAEEVAVSRCMRERGFEYAEMPYVSDEELRAQIPRPGDAEAAAQHGYGIAAHRGEQSFPEADSNEALRAKLTPEQLASWDLALRGQRASSVGLAPEDAHFARVETPDGTITWDKRSCWARGRQALHGDDEHNYALELRLNELRAQAEADALRAPAYQQALRAWRACMAQHGHGFESPDAAREAVAQDLEAIEDRSVALAREVAVAKDDAECDQRVGLREARQSSIAQSERIVEAENPETLVATAEQQRDTLARADLLLRGRDEEE